ncbi:hypothetical protein [Pseudomonas viridiflava]|uniref:hypothetical protein n=1 Tax=Pseudomonas viridiflava TaxID=33069 RepID=UPI001C2DEE65|nr:hypothetical protein [Pseudomonas viridiflava]MBV1809863.1 hypothetical protein [Pseudomonas viridiflava]
MAEFTDRVDVARVLGGAWNNAKTLPETGTKIALAFKQSGRGCYPVRLNGKGRAAGKFGYFNSGSVNFSQLGGGELDEQYGAALLGRYNGF